MINDTIVTQTGTKLEEKIDDLTFGGSFLEDNKKMEIHIELKAKRN